MSFSNSSVVYWQERAWGLKTSLGIESGSAAYWLCHMGKSFNFFKAYHFEDNNTNLKTWGLNVCKAPNPAPDT